MTNRYLLAGAVWFALLGLSIARPAPARASFEDVPVSARSIGMGAANVADVNEVQGMFLNPAALAGVNRYEAYLDYDKEMMGLSDGSSIGRQIVGLGAPFKFGTFALGINQFSAGSVYKENTMQFGFGRAVGRRTWLGFGMKNMSLTYTQDQYTRINPVFQKGAGKSGMGLDIGVIHQAKAGYRWALSIRDGNEPSMGIKYANKVDRKLDLGWSFHASDRLTVDPAINIAGKDYKLKFGVEYNKPRSNAFFRGGVNVGARDYRNLSFGFGYRAKTFQFDYAMNFPLSGVATTLGTHQIGITARWGRAKRKVARTEEEQQEQDDAETPAVNTGDLVQAKPAPATENDAEKAKQALEDAKRDLINGQFQAGLDKFKESDPSLVSPTEVEEAKAMAAKAAAIAPIFPSLREVDQRTRLLKLAVTAYLQGDGKKAVNAATYVAQLNPSDERIARVRNIILKAFPLETFDLKLLPGVKLTDQKLQEALELIYQGKYTSAVEACKDVLDLEPKNTLAMVRMGSAFWAMGMHRNARDIWRQAEKLDPSNDVLKKFLGGKLADEAEVAEPEKPSVTATPELRAEYKTKLDYYERLKRSGADNATLASILQKMLKQFEGTGVDLTDVYKEFERVRR